MPSRNTVKQYLENGLYHIYNRGVEKRDIFLDDQDYNVFLHLLKFYLSPIKSEKHPLSELTGFNPVRVRPLANLGEEVELLCYCLMPNHFHLLIKQNMDGGISKFLSNFQNSYTRYFNTRHQRDGTLFLNQFKAVRIETDEQLIHVSRYIHLNPYASHVIKDIDRLEYYRWSSFSEYISKGDGFVNKSLLLGFFKNAESYKTFVFDQADYQRTLKEIEHLALE